MAPIYLYSYRRCPYAMRARMALIYAGIDVEIREISLRNKPLSMLHLSPKGTVPVLVLEDRIIEESLDIMLWALQQNDPSDWFNPQIKALSLHLIQKNDLEFKPLLDAYKYPERQASSTDYFQKAIEIFLKPLNHLLEKNSYLVDDQIKLVDVAIFPFVRQFAKVDEVRFNALSLHHLHTWLSTMTRWSIFDLAMKKIPEWKEG